MTKITNGLVFLPWIENLTYPNQKHVMDVEFHPNPYFISSTTKSETSDNNASIINQLLSYLCNSNIHSILLFISNLHSNKAA